MSAACFVHDSTYTLMRQTCLTVCNSASRCCGEQRLLALLVRDLITPFFAELVVEEEYFAQRLWCGRVFCKLRWTCQGQGVSERRGRIRQGRGVPW